MNTQSTGKARARNGTGSVTFRKDKLWQGSVRFVDSDGKPRRCYVYGSTRGEAVARLEDARARLRGGAAPVDSRISLREFVAQWQASTLEASDRKRTTKAWYRDMLRVHVLGELGHLRLDALRPSHVERMLADMRAAGSSASTRRGAFTVVRAVLNTAVRDNLIAANPCDKVTRPRPSRHQARVLDASEIGALLAAAAGHRLHPLLLLLAYTGCRRGECLALRWRDIDPERATFTVAGTLAPVDGRLVRQEPKTPESMRTWPLAAPVVAALREHRKAMAAERLRMGSAWVGESGPDAPVFVSERGTYLDPRNVYRWVVRVAKTAGLDGVTPHVMRHSAASLALSAGVPLLTVSRMLGHRDLATTSDIYSHVLDGMQREAVDAIAATLAPAPVTHPFTHPSQG